MNQRLYIGWFCKGLLLLCLLLWSAQSVIGQMIDVPISLQVPLVLKATSFDRTFPSKLQKNGVLRVGICYQFEHRPSVQEMEALQEAFEKPAPGFKVEIVLMGFADDEKLEERKEWPSLSAIYITTMRGFDLQALLAQARKHQIMSIATNPNLVRKGTTMSFELMGQRAKFVINRNSSIAEGCDFSSQLLKLATIY